MSNPSYVSVPEPSNKNESLGESVRALKHNVELLTGQLKGQSQGAPRIFLQSTEPNTSDAGDLWVNTGTNKLYYWSGQKWTALT